MEINDREKLVAAFEHMVENVSESVHRAEEALEPTIDEMVHNAQQLAREVFTLTQEEAESLGATLKRDMQKANQVMNQQKKELKDWLSFDLTLVEDRFIDMIARAADKTWLDFRAFESEDHQASLYKSGEVCNAGSFSCCKCGEIVRLPSAGQIAACPACQHEKFYRVVG
jgi:cell division septum initiation protein DivIVA/DNA-directed RNA polymerase subunit RPC12/RpoP